MSHSSPLLKYLEDSSSGDRVLDTGLIAYLASLEQISHVSPEVAKSIVAELSDQQSSLKMIASENYSSLAVQLAQGNLFTDKYAEGVPNHRFYAGCDNVDSVESLAGRLACSLFGADHAYMQPHSGADANLVAFWAILEKRVQAPFMDDFGQADPSKLNELQWSKLRKALGNQRLLGMNYYSGGHLTHGYRHNLSAKMFEASSYDVDPKSHTIDYEDLRVQAKAFKPLILLAGYSAYPRHIDFKAFREIADEVGAVLMVDMAHFSGLVAGKVFTGNNDPVAHADVVTSTTHKTLRGPRGGMVLCTNEFAEYVDRGCPMVMGGPLPHVIAAKAVALQEASSDEFRVYAQHIVDNAVTLAEACIAEEMVLITGGTDNHLMLLDVTPFGITGRQAEAVLRSANITLNRNSIPFDANGPWYTSGLRMGTPALTTRGMGKSEMREIASIIKLVLSNTEPTTITKGKNIGSVSKAKYRIDPDILSTASTRVRDLLSEFPLYKELDVEWLKRCVG